MWCDTTSQKIYKIKEITQFNIYHTMLLEEAQKTAVLLDILLESEE